MSYFTIIIPAYNISRYIAHSLSSVFNQSYKDYELIIIDDGSTDDTYRIVNELVESRSNVKVLSIKNSGPNYARNLGIELSSGKFIIFVDADDFLHSNALMYLANVINGQDIDFIEYGYLFDDFKSDSARDAQKFEPSEEILLQPSIFKSNLAGSSISSVCWSKCISRDFLLRNDIKFFPDKMHGRDILFCRQLSFFAKKVLITNALIYYSRIRPGSFSRSFTIKNVQSAIDLARKLEVFYVQAQVPATKNEIGCSFSKYFGYILVLAAMRMDRSGLVNAYKLVASTEFNQYLSLRYNLYNFNFKNLLKVILVEISLGAIGNKFVKTFFRDPY